MDHRRIGNGAGGGEGPAARQWGKRMTEKQLQNAILRKFGTDPTMRLWRQNTGVAVVGDTSKIMRVCKRLGIPCRMVRFGVPGQADLTGIMADGRRLEIEVKSVSGRQTDEQKNYQAMIEKLGGEYVLARSVDDVRAALGGKA